MDLIMKNIDIRLHNQSIIQDVSLSVQRGEFVGIIGPNGSGKSTLLRSIYRVIKPTSGAIFLNGTELNHMKLADSAKLISVVSQFNAINFDFSVLDMVLMGRTPHKSLLGTNGQEDYQIVLEALHKVGMAEAIHRNFSTLSGGEKQRILLARALAQQPQILLLDEPTNHLDVNYQLQILGIVKSLDIGVLAVLHDLNLAAMYCDQIYVLKDGKIVADGPPEQILTPQLVEDVYEIQCEIRKNARTGCLDISYYPYGYYPPVARGGSDG